MDKRSINDVPIDRLVVEAVRDEKFSQSKKPNKSKPRAFPRMKKQKGLGKSL